MFPPAVLSYLYSHAHICIMAALQLQVRKIYETPERTVSMLSVDGRDFCFILEDGYREKKEYQVRPESPVVFTILSLVLSVLFSKNTRRITNTSIPSKFPACLILSKSCRTSATSYAIPAIACWLVSDATSTRVFMVLKRSTEGYLDLYTIISKYFDAGTPVWIASNQVQEFWKHLTGSGRQ